MLGFLVGEGLEVGLVVDVVLVFAGVEAVEELGADFGAGGIVKFDEEGGVVEFFVAVFVLDGIEEGGGFMVVEEVGGFLVAVGLKTDGAAGVHDVEGGIILILEVVGEVVFDVPGLEAVGDGFENLRPFAADLADFFWDGAGFDLVDAAGFGAEAALGRLSDVASAEDPEGKKGFNGDDEGPDGDKDDKDGGNFDDDAEGFDPFGVGEDDFFQNGVFDVVLEISVAFLEANFFEDAVPGFFEDSPIFAADVTLENAEEGHDDRDETEDDEGSNADHYDISFPF